MSEKPKAIGWFIEKYWKSTKTWVFYDFHTRKPESHRQLAELLNPHEPNAKYRWCPVVRKTDAEKLSEALWAVTIDPTDRIPCRHCIRKVSIANEALERAKDNSELSPADYPQLQELSKLIVAALKDFDKYKKENHMAESFDCEVGYVETLIYNFTQGYARRFKC